MIDKNKKNYAVCIFGQLRAVDIIIDNFNKFLIDELNADLFICAQKTGTDSDKYIDLFNTENKIIYSSSNVTETFINYHCLDKKNNYNSIANLNCYENLFKINELFGDKLENDYNYIIVTRSDFLYLFPFPDIIKLMNNNDIFFKYHGHDWGGINATLMCIPSHKIKEYLCSYNFLNDKNNINLLNSLDLNAERYIKLIFETKGWIYSTIDPNSFITASGFDTITTFGTIKYCTIYNVFFKYDEQKDLAFHLLNQYNNNARWSIVFFMMVDNNIIHKIILS
jgi:hypothetical protein